MSSVEIHLKNLFNFCVSHIYVTYKRHIYKSVELTLFSFSLPLVSLSASPAL